MTETINQPQQASSKKTKVVSKGVQGTAGKVSVGKKKIKKVITMGVDLVKEKNQHYQTAYRNLVRIIVIQYILVIFLAVAFLFYMHVSRPQDFYFATTHDGRELQLIPLGQPNMQKAALLSWAAQAASEVMTFGFNDFETRLQKSSRHFTPKGWEDFRKAMLKSRIIEGVEDAQQIVTSVPKSAPIMTGEGLYNGKHRWVVDLTLLVTYQSGEAKNTSTMHVTLFIERVPTLESPNGVGIEQWIAM